jgi:hypothetical protein
MVLENQIGLGVFVSERVRANPVMFEKLLNLHRSPPD